MRLTQREGFWCFEIPTTVLGCEELCVVDVLRLIGFRWKFLDCGCRLGLFFHKRPPPVPFVGVILSNLVSARVETNMGRGHGVSSSLVKQFVIPP